MPTRTARTAWTGSLEQGSGTVELASSGAGSFEVSFPRRSAEQAGGVTSPEELIAAAHTSCFAMQLSALIARAGGTPGSLDVRADVTLNRVEGALAITGIKLTVHGTAEGLDEAGFRRAAEQAKEQCPVSKALAATPMELEASFG